MYAQRSNLASDGERLHEERLLVHERERGLRLAFAASGGSGEAPEPMRAAAIHRQSGGPRGESTGIHVPYLEASLQ